ncbi:uncharacterized protein LOC123409728 [Hordeum vulgare subsp. vulgare]|uniref:uncharacterized protein LOC123409728 n=1 Tax=Hordeum vulgare subsp. vulgare TaxID=112509 RepID=UPI001D1A3BE8|nr:uncharacterized protein LOC123409728 [Hordeum vulgare subsp. vulgare]
MELLPHNHALVEELRLRHRIWTLIWQQPQPWSSPRAPETLAHLHPWRPPLFHLHPWQPCCGRSQVSSPTTRIGTGASSRPGYESLLPFSSPLVFSPSDLCDLCSCRSLLVACVKGFNLAPPCFLPRKSRVSLPYCRPAPDVAKRFHSEERKCKHRHAKDYL